MTNSCFCYPLKYSLGVYCCGESNRERESVQWLHYKYRRRCCVALRIISSLFSYVLPALNICRWYWHAVMWIWGTDNVFFIVMKCYRESLTWKISANQYSIEIDFDILYKDLDLWIFGFKVIQIHIELIKLEKSQNGCSGKRSFFNINFPIPFFQDKSLTRRNSTLYFIFDWIKRERQTRSCNLASLVLNGDHNKVSSFW